MNNQSESKIAAENLFKSSGYRYKIIISSIISALIIFGGLGWLVDYFVGSKPIGIIVGFIVSFIASQYFVYKKLSQYTKKLLDNK
ncbi:hypothetical protein GW933_04295 [Candidatus Falkowbacteria bacterium]|uniref:AtpZ/AtpI family protein n=1 Tax=Candidatus Buchananbacteria bacterium CG10_big_fil_rev_8_21_14_0_10_33_19 TaxID=1974525 RepID=A0A2H0W590_9BACT|nr:hypothetical protein [Candidatus Falkowbacteria bacterium]PIS06447.1 MAG: hypothetical protein COT80_00700 [Candidatus Buchananbacteria bacterium CG10_big_fil_rev_8_21_14_0_10_33_19]